MIPKIRRDNPKILLINSPRRYWPFVNEQDNFLLPQGYACLAGSLRAAGYNVKVVDCLPLKMGWRSVYQLLRDEKPDIVGAGENHAIYAGEAGRLFRMAKEIDPNIITVAGGAHLTMLHESAFRDFPIDIMVQGEGEVTIVELVKELCNEQPNLRGVEGILFREDKETVITPARPLVRNLDDLPLPAYDLLPMELYGRSKYLFSPGGATIFHSRGCPSSCSFCSWWIQMADREVTDEGEFKLKPRWRTKSVDRTLEEIDILVNQYGKGCLVFVDDSWNINPKWNDAFAEEVLRRKMKFQFMAFMRADALLRDERLGIMEKVVKAGLTHTCIGVERATDKDLKDFNKPFYQQAKTVEAFRILREKYPSVFRQATFIVGTREETEETLQVQVEFAKKIQPDYPAFHPITPVPGTVVYDQAVQEGWLELQDFSYYDWMTPVVKMKNMSRERMEDLLVHANQQLVSIGWLLRGLFSKSEYRRKLYIWWVIVMIKVTFTSLKLRWVPFSRRVYTTMIEPEWYNT